MAKNISDFIGALLFVGFFIGAVSLFVAAGSIQYNITYDNATFSGYDYIGRINSTAEQLSASSQNISTSQGNAFDIVGTLFNQGYSAVLITKDSFGFGYAIVNNVQNKIGFGGSILKLLVTTLTVLLTITISFILLRAIFKEQL